MSQINAQTPSPLEWIGTHNAPKARAYLTSQSEETPHLLVILDGGQPNTNDARLLASAYTAFDKAGRSLGIDAAELAERIDLAEVIRAAFDHATYTRDKTGERAPGEPLTDCAAKLLRSHLFALFPSP